MNALGRSRRHDQIPSGFQDSARSERLPELHVEVSSGSFASYQTHCFIYDN